MKLSIAVLFVLLVLAGTEAFGQTSRFSAGLCVSADHYMRVSRIYYPYNSYDNWGMGGGIAVRYQSAKWLGLKMAIHFSDKSYSERFNENLVEGRIDPDSHMPETIDFTEHSVEMPLLLTAKTAKIGRFSLVPAAGILNSCLIRKDNRAVLPDGTVYKNRTSLNLRDRYSIGALFELGVAVQAGERLSLMASPRYWTRFPVKKKHPLDRVEGLADALGGTIEVLYCF